MNTDFLKRLFRRRPTVVKLDDPQWAEQQRRLRERLAALPENDTLMRGLLAWQDRRLAMLVDECNQRDLTGDEALSLVHRIAEVAGYRRDLEQTWTAARMKVAEDARKSG